MPRRSGRRRGDTARGVVLIEALIAVVIIGFALLLVVALLTHEARLFVRASAQRDAERLLEATLEGLRAGDLWLEAGTRTYTSAGALEPWRPIPPGSVLWVTVTQLGTPGLWEVTAKVRYRAGRDILERSVTTRMWTG